MLLGEFTLQSTPVFCFPVLYYHILLMQPNLLSPLPPFHSISPSPQVFQTYASRRGVDVSSLRFLLDGERIDAAETPKSLELDDQDQIDCMLEQTGGYF